MIQWLHCGAQTFIPSANLYIFMTESPVVTTIQFTSYPLFLCHCYHMWFNHLCLTEGMNFCAPKYNQWLWSWTWPTLSHTPLLNKVAELMCISDLASCCLVVCGGADDGVGPGESIAVWGVGRRQQHMTQISAGTKCAKFMHGTNIMIHKFCMKGKKKYAET